MSRIQDLGAISSTAACNRVDGDLFKMTISSNFTVSLDNFEDGDLVTFAVSNTSGSAKDITITNTVIWAIAYGSAPSFNASQTVYLTLRCFDGVFLELGRGHS